MRLLSQLQSAWGRSDIGKINQASLGLADHLLRYHQDVSVFEMQVGALDGCQDNSRQIIAGLDGRNLWDGKQFDVHR